MKRAIRRAALDAALRTAGLAALGALCVGCNFVLGTGELTFSDTGGGQTGTSTSSTESTSVSSGGTGGATATGAAAGTGGIGGTAGLGGSGGSTPICGNGFIEAGEECDDGDQDDNDGCTACVVDCSETDAHKDPSTNHCYFEFAGFKTWDDARLDCIFGFGDGVELVAPSTQSEIDYLETILSTSSDHWIGGFDPDNDLIFEWSNGEKWSYVNDQPPWAANEPDASPGTCIYLRTSLKPFVLYDQACTNGHAWICERTPMGR